MKSFAAACGEPLCKKQFRVEVDEQQPWPIRCPACNRSLYPDDILAAASLENLDANRGPLMRVYGGRLVPVASRELAPALAQDPGLAIGRSLVDDILDADGGRPARRRRLPVVWIAVAVVLAVAVALALWRLL